MSNGLGDPGWSENCKKRYIMRNRDLIYGELDEIKLLMKSV